MFELPKLPYAYDALEPYIDQQTMMIHHDKHHQGYTDKFNAALEGHEDLLNMSAEDIIAHLDQVPEEIRMAVRNNGGGYVNHALFWTVMTPDYQEMSPELEAVIKQNFGSVAEFKEKFTQAAATQFGSGWGWLVATGPGKLEIMSTPNQDSPLSMGKTPLLAVDVWEHAYYLKYQNKRPDYLENFWKVVNWAEVEARLNQVS